MEQRQALPAHQVDWHQHQVIECFVSCGLSAARVLAISQVPAAEWCQVNGPAICCLFHAAIQGFLQRSAACAPLGMRPSGLLLMLEPYQAALHCTFPLQRKLHQFSDEGLEGPHHRDHIGFPSWVCNESFLKCSKTHQKFSPSSTIRPNGNLQAGQDWSNHPS